MSFDFKKYGKFIQSRTSNESENYDHLHKRIEQLRAENFNPALVLNSACGLSSETGEIMELVKKIFFQGKEVTPENHYHMEREMGDIFFYWVNMCRALNLDPEKVIQENVDKLTARYPDGKFKIEHSENRKKGDL